MIAALLQIIDNNKKGKPHNMSKYKWRDIFPPPPFVVSLFSYSKKNKNEHDENVKKSLKVIVARVVKENGHYIKEVYLSNEKFPIALFCKGAKWEKICSFPQHKRLVCVVCIIFARFSCSLCLRGKLHERFCGGEQWAAIITCRGDYVFIWVENQKLEMCKK